MQFFRGASVELYTSCPSLYPSFRKSGVQQVLSTHGCHSYCKTLPELHSYHQGWRNQKDLSALLVYTRCMPRNLQGERLLFSTAAVVIAHPFLPIFLLHHFLQKNTYILMFVEVPCTSTCLRYLKPFSFCHYNNYTVLLYTFDICFQFSTFFLLPQVLGSPFMSICPNFPYTSAQQLQFSVSDALQLKLVIADREKITSASSLCISVWVQRWPITLQ